MTTHERIERMFEHREADRVPVMDRPWRSTVQRWHQEGMPEGVHYSDFFDLDEIVHIEVDTSPRYPERVVEETAEYVVATTRWGVTQKTWRHIGGVPEFLDYTVVDPESWARAKERMEPTRDRIDWNRLDRSYAEWRRKGKWISARFWFGFDVTHAHVVGTERLLVAMLEQPEWLVDIFNAQLDMDIALFEMIWKAGYRFDEMRWPDDMGYKGHQFFSLQTYRDLLKPVHKRAVEWAHGKGIVARLHSCGNVNPFIPELIDIGLDMIHPLEVKAGMNPVQLKAQYGEQLGFHGGLNAVLFDEPDALWTEMEQTIPAMKRGGGYVASSDHSVPQSVSLDTFRTFVRLAKELGSYG